MKHSLEPKQSLGFDPVIMEVMLNAFMTLCDESQAILVRSAYSTNIKERKDCSAWLLDSDGQPFCGGRYSGGQYNNSGYGPVGARILEKFGSNLSDGDVFVMNDPYLGGPTHLPDMSFLKPVFYDGELLCFVCNQGHWADVGGKAPAQGVVGDATEIYQEGLRLPPVALYKSGRLEEDIYEIMLANIRGPHERAADIRAHMAALHLAERRVHELAQRYGAKGLKRYMRALVDYSETRLRQAILDTPEGSWSAVDYLDDDLGSDEPIAVKVKVSIKHSPRTLIVVDFTGSGPPAKWGINVAYHGTWQMVVGVFRNILVDDTVPINAGFLKPFKVIMPDHSLINAKPPSAVGARTETTYLVRDVILAALMEAFPEKVRGPWHGVHGVGFSNREDQRYFIHYQTVGGGGGARTFKDGVDSVHEVLNLPVEPMEMQYPLRGLRLEYIQDSEGAGKYRGGVGVRQDWEVLADVNLATHSNRHKIPAPGVSGGWPGGLSRLVLNYDSDDPVELPRETANYPLKKGDVVTVFAGGGGGYASPLDRDPEAVLSDVRNGKVSLDRALEVYGVAIDAESWMVLEEETVALRKARG